MDTEASEDKVARLLRRRPFDEVFERYGTDHKHLHSMNQDSHKSLPMHIRMAGWTIEEFIAECESKPEGNGYEHLIAMQLRKYGTNQYETKKWWQIWK